MTCVLLIPAEFVVPVEDLIVLVTAARVLGCPPAQVKRYASARRLTVIEIDSHKFYNRREVVALRAMLDQRKAEGRKQLPNRKQPDEPAVNRAPRVPLPVEPSE